jgi:hypothetical protein
MVQYIRTVDKFLNSDEATSEEFVRSSPLIPTLITLEHMVIYHR